MREGIQAKVDNKECIFPFQLVSSGFLSNLYLQKFDKQINRYRLCYEFTNINSRALLKNKVELILVPEFNKDTNYFSNIIETTVRDNMCFIAQSNTSQYGDSCITGPYKTERKNILKIKGAKNNNMLVEDIEIYKLMEYKRLIQKKSTSDEANKICGTKKDDGFKEPPAGFFS